MANLLMPLQIERQYGASLDADYSFDTLDELKNYAITSALSYSGQILYCKENDTLYKVNNDKTDVGTLGGVKADIPIIENGKDIVYHKITKNRSITELEAYTDRNGGTGYKIDDLYLTYDCEKLAKGFDDWFAE